MARNRGFEHKGEVISVDGESGVVVVSIRSSTACEGCHAKGHCVSGGGITGSQDQTRQIRIECSDAANYSVGEVVEVSVSYSLGFFAVMVSYILPLMLFVLTIAVLVAMEIDEGISAIVGCVFGALYYGLIYLLRERFERVVHFEVRRLN